MDVASARGVQTSDRTGRLLMVAVVGALFLWMIHELLVPVVLAFVFALLLYPISVWLNRKLGRFGRLAPFLTTAAALFLVVIPLGAMTAQAVTSITDFVSTLEPGEVGQVQNSLLARISEAAASIGIPTDRIRETSTQLVQTAGRQTAEFLQNLLSSVPDALIGLFIFVLSLYFFLRDGHLLGGKLILLSPFEDEDTDSLFDSIVGTVRGAILSTIAVAFVQGSLTTIAFLIFSVPGAFLFGLLAGFLSLIPMVGTIPVTGGAVLYLLLVGRYGAAIGLAIVAVVVIGTSDNIVRPLVQTVGSQLHPLMAILGIFGGLAVMGPAGIFIGPVVAALVLWLVDYVAKRRSAHTTPQIAISS